MHRITFQFSRKKRAVKVQEKVQILRDAGESIALASLGANRQEMNTQFPTDTRSTRKGEFRQERRSPQA